MRLPSEYISAAVRGIITRSMPDCAMTLTCGENSARVTRVTNTNRGDDEVFDTDVSEGLRVFAAAHDFPGLAKDDIVDLDETVRIVTSARRDPTGSLLYVGLSKAFDFRSVGYHGDRPDGVRINGTVGCAIVENGLGAEFEGIEGAAPGLKRVVVYVRRIDFAAFASVPQVGDTVVTEEGRRYRIGSVDESGRNLYRMEARVC